MHTVDSAKAWAAANSADIRKSLAESVVVPESLKAEAIIVDLWSAGSWLDAVLRAAGCDDGERSNICFAHGQRCFGRDPFVEAVRLANEFEATGTTKDRPGSRLADEINDELFDRLDISAAD